MTAKTKFQIAASIVSLTLLLVYTFWHTGGLLARYIEPRQLGYLCAAGIELAVVVLSIQIGSLRQTRQDPGFFLAVLVAVVVISALANMAEGYRTRYGADLTVATIGTIDLLQAVFGVAATGLISLVVFSMAEIVGQDVNAMRAPEAARTEPGPAATLTDDQARLVAFYQRNPSASQAAAGQHVGRSRQWVGTALAELEAAGVVSRNGNGVEIREVGQ